MFDDLQKSKKGLIKELVQLRMENRALRKKIADKGRKVNAIKNAVSRVRDRMRKEARESDGSFFDDLLTYKLNQYAYELDSIVSPETKQSLPEGTK